MKKSLFNLGIVIAVISMIFISCEEVPVVIPMDVVVPDNDRTVLIEDLTGVQCPNCPRGNKEIERILEVTEGKVFAIGLHGDLQADPLPESKYDFRNDFAKKLEDFHAPFLGKPSAVINRVAFDGELFTAVDNIGVWNKYVLDELAKEVTVNINLSHTYDSSSRRIDVTADINPLIDDASNYRVSVFVTESEIEDPQEDIGVIIDDYVHMHVLRHMMTSFDGDVLGTFIKDQSFRKSFSYTVPQEFNTDHIEVVVSVHKSSSSDKSIVQSAGFKLK